MPSLAPLIASRPSIPLGLNAMLPATRVNRVDLEVSRKKPPSAVKHALVWNGTASATNRNALYRANSVIGSNGATALRRAVPVSRLALAP